MTIRNELVFIFSPGDENWARWAEETLRVAKFTCRITYRNEPPLTLEPEELGLAIISDTSEMMPLPSRYIELVAQDRIRPITFTGNPVPPPFAANTLIDLSSYLGNTVARGLHLVQAVTNFTTA